ncbi:SURF1 family protein [Methylonatrum kenyense]|uniref:SURF1 family protein n=1 Tax=Methylonatrum kenyense TaxID=455253 RepID=UPI0020C0DE90|nr:SURF1 family protein [Methylonatrum kenyense]MCK8516919.1 SURF1 family protein [Methylonatrum kenyense]
MRIGSFDFRPGMVPTLAFLLLLPVLVGLGFWQLDRAEQRAGLLASFDAQRTAAPVNLNRDRLDPEAMLFRPARAEGEFLPERSLLLDNQTHRRTVGYHVLTPYRLAGDDRVVLVDRGWVPAGESRAQLPEVGMESTEIPIEGHLDQGPATGIRLGGLADGESGWPLRIQYIDYAELGARVDAELLPVVLRLAPDSAEGFVREWRPEHPDGYGPERNRAYAVQWFGLAAALVVIYLAVNLRRRPEELND